MNRRQGYAIWDPLIALRKSREPLFLILLQPAVVLPLFYRVVAVTAAWSRREDAPFLCETCRVGGNQSTLANL
jgi:hypothetical protein